jgi:hypothetical protein
MNLKEEKATDKKLSAIATRKINKKAYAAQKKREAKLEKRPTTAEHAENAMLAMASGIPAI